MLTVKRNGTLSKAQENAVVFLVNKVNYRVLIKKLTWWTATSNISNTTHKDLSCLWP